MAYKTEFNKKAHTKQEAIDYFNLHTKNFKNGIYTNGISPDKWDQGGFRAYDGKCMNCGCPEKNSNMENSPDAYLCTICLKKSIGEETFIRHKKKIEDFQKATLGMNSKEIMNYIKKSLKL